MNREKFSERLKTLRIERAESFSHLATLLGIAKQSVHSWESMKTAPSLDNLRLLASHFGVSINYLMGETDDPKIVDSGTSGENKHRKNFSYWIAEFRRQKNQTLQEVGEATGISPKRLALLEKGEQPPTFEELVKLADHLRVPFDFLLGDEIAPLKSSRRANANTSNNFLDTPMPYPYNCPPLALLRFSVENEKESAESTQEKEKWDICHMAVCELTREHFANQKRFCYNRIEDAEDDFLHHVENGLLLSNSNIYKAVRKVAEFDRNRIGMELRKKMADILEEAARILRTDETEEERQERFNRLMLKEGRQ